MSSLSTSKGYNYLTYYYQLNSAEARNCSLHKICWWYPFDHIRFGFTHKNMKICWLLFFSFLSSYCPHNSVGFYTPIQIHFQSYICRFGHSYRCQVNKINLEINANIQFTRYMDIWIGLTCMHLFYSSLYDLILLFCFHLVSFSDSITVYISILFFWFALHLSLALFDRVHWNLWVTFVRKKNYALKLMKIAICQIIEFVIGILLKSSTYIGVQFAIFETFAAQNQLKNVWLEVFHQLTKKEFCFHSIRICKSTCSILFFRIHTGNKNAVFETKRWTYLSSPII